MAYEIYIASVRDELIKELSQIKHPDENSSIEKNEIKIASISHYFVSNTAELGLDFDRALVAAIEEGTDLNFWHPLRPPRFYFSNEASVIFQKLEMEWKKVLNKFTKEDLQFHVMDFDPIFRIYMNSKVNNLGIVSFLSKPRDERANNVIYPIKG